MFLAFFAELRAARLPVSLREYLGLVEGVEKGVAGLSVEGFYHLARTCLVKDERNLDAFDRVFARSFRGIAAPPAAEGAAPPALPQEWLRKLAEKHLSPEERAAIERLGWDRLWETLRQRPAEQRGRHQGGSKWIGTAGTSPFGAYGENPEGIRVGQDGNRTFSAVKVWDRREFRDLDGGAELSGRAMKIALRRLRRFARTGAADELDLDGTVRETAARGYLDVMMRPERRNAAKVLLLLDVGGSMDWHVEQAEQLFSAARAEFKRLTTYYFHNCPYEALWPSARRRREFATPTRDVLATLPPDTKLVIVGDAAMSPYEVVQPGGSVEHWNEEPGAVWLERLTAAFPAAAWINPLPRPQWDYTQSIGLVRGAMGGRMYPLTLEGLEGAMRALSR